MNLLLVGAASLPIGYMAYGFIALVVPPKCASFFAEAERASACLSGHTVCAILVTSVQKQVLACFLWPSADLQFSNYRRVCD